jgi:hypothetical protein
MKLNKQDLSIQENLSGTVSSTMFINLASTDNKSYNLHSYLSFYFEGA